MTTTTTKAAPKPKAAPKGPSATDVAVAAATWAAAKRATKAAEPALKASAVVLKAHFTATATTDYKGLVGYACTPTVNLMLDEIRAELGDRLAEFERPGKRETLSLLK